LSRATAEGPTGKEGPEGKEGKTGPANGLVIGSSGNTSLGATSQSSCFFIGVGAAVSTATTCTNAAVTQVPMPVSGTVKTFYVSFSQTGGSHNDQMTFEIRKNGTAQATSKCVPTSSGTSCNVTGLSIAFTAGELLDVQVKASGGQTPTPGVVTWGVQYQ
jgi:hypothetical protein